MAETSVAQRTRVRFVPRVNAHVTLQTRVRRAGLVTNEALVRLVPTVKSAMSNQTSTCAESFAADTTRKRSLTGMTAPVHCQFAIVSAILSAFGAHVFTGVNVHVRSQVAHSRKTFLALRARVRPFSAVRLYVFVQVCRLCKPFVAHRTYEGFLSALSSRM